MWQPTKESCPSIHYLPRTTS
uniref:Uncharacterized protein n=1 Tax=Rhizophora mucronata TaxID=61149 RepID=A0A2P2NBY7_RHIMU